MNAKKANILLMIASILWGSCLIASNVALENGFEPFSLITSRYLVSAFIMIILLNKSIKKISKGEIICGAIPGICNALGNTLQMHGLKHTSLSNNAFLGSTYVIMVPFLCWMLFKRKPDSYSLIGAFISAMGISFLTLGENFNISIGDIYSLVSSVFYAFGLVATGMLLKDNSPINVTFIQFLSGGIMLLCFIPFEKPTGSIGSLGYIAVLYMAIFATVVPYIFQNFAFKYTDPTRGTVILSIQSIFSTILSVLILKEGLSIKAVLGCIIIFASILFTELKPRIKLPGAMITIMCRLNLNRKLKKIKPVN